MKNNCYIISCFLLLIVNHSLTAQQVVQYLDSARSLAKQEAYQKAEKVLMKGLQKHENDHDLLAYHVRLQLWQHDYEKAEQAINHLFSLFPEGREGFELVTTLHLWQENWQELLYWSERALAGESENLDFQYRKLLALVRMGARQRAYAFFLFLESPDSRARQLIRELRLRYHDRLALSFSHARFDETLNPWTLVSLAYHRASENSWNVTGTFGQMFDQTGASIAATHYGRLSKVFTSVIDVGGGKGEIFPQLNGGAELSGSFGKTSLMLGARALYFEGEAETVKIFTFGAAQYFRDYYFRYKAYHSFIENTGEVTHTMMFRRFFTNRFHFLQLNGTEGNVPLRISNFDEVSRLSARSLSATYSHLIAEKYILQASLGGQQERFRQGNKRIRRTFSLSFSRIF